MVTNKGGIKIRRMTQADLAKVIDIDQSLSGLQRVPTWPFSFESYWAVYRPELSFVAEINGDIVGFVVGNIVQDEHSQSIFGLRHTGEPTSRHRWIGWIDMIGICPEHQHKGIGRGLIEAFNTECKRHNAVMRGLAHENDEVLKKFLSSLGFKRSDVAIYEKE
ncbi:MAG: GNAT family N-acetyltransferase [Chloroflexota bacterium]